MSDKLDEKLMEVRGRLVELQMDAEAEVLGEVYALLQSACPGSTGAAEGWVLVPKEVVERAQHALAASEFSDDRCVAAEISAMLSAAVESEG